MCINSIEDEVDNFKNSSRFKIKMMIMIYRCLRFCNSDTYYFLFSLLVIIGPIIFISFDILALFISMTFHYFFFWKYLKDKLNRLYQTEKEIEEIDEIILILKSYLKNKNPN
jgi:hypothetical protein